MAKTIYTATSGDDIWVFSKGSTLVTLDGLAGTDIMSFGSFKLTAASITESSAGAVRIDTVSGASVKKTYTLELKNVETLKFSNGANLIDLTTYFTIASGTATSGNDTLKGVSGNDTLAGDDGNDAIIGLGGNDTLSGGNGNDTLSAGNGDDRLTGGAGKDSLTGGDGADTFVFNALKSGEYGSITDFGDDDVLEFDTTVFDKLVGATSDNFVTGAKAKGADDYLIYNKGKLYYDADGWGKGIAIQIAGIKGTDAKSLTSDDIHFV
jgi:Ca2+-binding RTX toxin-like protein